MTSFPDHLLDPEHLEFRKTCARFAEREILPYVHDWEEAGSFPRELYTKAAGAGLLGVGFPERFGGSGGTILHCMMAAEGLHAGTSGGIVAGLGSLGIALPPLMTRGSEEQKERIARPAFEGNAILALAVTEPGTGSDVAGISTRAVRDGNGYRIRGAKLFITSGVRATGYMALCRTGEDPHNGLTFFFIERDSEGVRVSAPLKKTGWWASDTAEIGFENVWVPESNRIGTEGSGFLAVMENFQQERLVLATYGHTLADLALAEATHYAREREAFGKPLSRMQVIRHKLADMATQVTAAKTLNYTLGRALANGDTRIQEVSMAKNFSSRVAMEVTYEAVQIFGGMGYMRETAVERLSRDARLLPIGGGTQEIMNEIIAKSMGL